ncbi:KdsC family phosphatase [Lunatibacter salilacus]|uniref:KdsC family phosphatase n=1 Tax=Lunatibacter salilacus TaxID=2483804 RepID=UPI00131B32FF|nr:HAD hydrolase family protein [Lunatibacter salilacus]
MYTPQTLLPELVKKIQNIRVLITDVDGVLTNGGIILDDKGMEYKQFQVKDGQIIAFLQAAGIQTGVISGRDVAVVKNRCQQMGLDFHYHGVRDKYAKVREILSDLGFTPDQCAYLGDDLIDLEILSKVGFSAAPMDALPYVKDQVDFICSLRGGEGAFREVADTILATKGALQGIVAKLINRQYEG